MILSVYGKVSTVTFWLQQICRSKVNSEFQIIWKKNVGWVLYYLWYGKISSYLNYRWCGEVGRQVNVRATCHRSWSQTLAVVLCSSVSLVNSLLLTSFAQYVYSDSSSCFCEQHGKGTVKWRAQTNFLAGTEEPVRIYQIGEKEP